MIHNRLCHFWAKAFAKFRSPCFAGLPSIILSAFMFFGICPCAICAADADQSSNPAKQFTLEHLGNAEVTTVSKEPKQVWKTTAAIHARRCGGENG
jgi:hypothetical protein